MYLLKLILASLRSIFSFLSWESVYRQLLLIVTFWNDLGVYICWAFSRYISLKLLLVKNSYIFMTMSGIPRELKLVILQKSYRSRYTLCLSTSSVSTSMNRLKLMSLLMKGFLLFGITIWKGSSSFGTVSVSILIWYF